MSAFSIIMPVYNVAPYLRDSLDSVCRQTFSDFECICVDDGSTDASGEILDEYAKKDMRFRIIHQSNVGVSGARNVALDVAQGNWIVFLDSDDVLAPCLLESVIEASENFPESDMVTYRLQTFAEGEVLAWRDERGKKFHPRTGMDVLSLAQQGFWCKTYKRNLIGHLRFKPYVVGEDLLFMLEVMLHADMCVEMDSRMYGYRLRLGSVTRCAASPRKVSDMFHSSFERLGLLSEARMPVHLGLRRIVENAVTENTVAAFAALAPQVRKNLFKEWVRLLKVAVEHGGFSSFQLFRVKLILALRSYPVAWLLFALPFGLKRMGFHR